MHPVYENGLSKPNTDSLPARDACQTRVTSTKAAPRKLVLEPSGFLPAS